MGEYAKRIRELTSDYRDELEKIVREMGEALGDSEQSAVGTAVEDVADAADDLAALVHQLEESEGE